MGQIEHKTISDADGEGRLDRWFKRHYPDLKYGQLEKLCRTGQVRVDGGRVKPNSRVTPGQDVRLPPQVTSPIPAKPTHHGISDQDKTFMQDLVIYQDDHIIALNKPAGLAAQGGSKTKRHLDGLLTAFGTGQKKPRLVHRLDRDTSGLMIVAKTPAAAAHLGQQFAGRDMEKTYLAILQGVPVPHHGWIEAPLIKGTHGSDREKMLIADPGQGDKAETEYQVLSTAGQQASLVALRPHTGRTHQLRAHTLAIGHPILGDPKYNLRDGPNPEQTVKATVGDDLKLQLHAYALTFTHMDGQAMTLRAPISPELQAGFARFGFLRQDIPKTIFEGDA